eukprot:scaffold85655_cov54-Phaeocystis_antarctica.AAC.2
MPNHTQIILCNPSLSARHADAVPVARANLRVVEREVVGVGGAHLCWCHRDVRRRVGGMV